MPCCVRSASGVPCLVQSWPCLDPRGYAFNFQPFLLQERKSQIHPYLDLSFYNLPTTKTWNQPFNSICSNISDRGIAASPPTPDFYTFTPKTHRGANWTSDHMASSSSDVNPATETLLCVGPFEVLRLIPAVFQPDEIKRYLTQYYFVFVLTLQCQPAAKQSVQQQIYNLVTPTTTRVEHFGQTGAGASALPKITPGV